MSTRPNAYGLWPSPITAERVADQSLRLGAARADVTHLYWTEGRPAEGGRVALMRVPLAGGPPQEVSPLDVSVRTRVHEYGGVPFALDGRGGLAYVNDTDQDVYLLSAEAIEAGAAPRRLTVASGWRFAELAFDPVRPRLVAVVEMLPGSPGHPAGRAADPDEPVPHHPQAAIVEIGLEVGETIAGAPESAVAILVAGDDFYAAPSLSPDGQHMSWLAWCLPDMPWDQAAVFAARLDDHAHPEAPHRVGGGDGVAALQPEWGPDGALYFIDDAQGDGRLRRLPMSDHGATAATPQAVETVDLGPGDLFRPLWGLGTRVFAFSSDGAALAAITSDQGTPRLVVRGPDGTLTRPDMPHRAFDSLVAAGDGFAALVTHDAAPPSLDRFGADGRNVARIAPPDTLGLAPGDVSIGAQIAFEGRDGVTIHGVFYPPTNAAVTPPPDGAPPAIVMVHGGPTGSADRGLKLKIQFWTSRGFAVLDLDHRGSTGYGRAYRAALDGGWGVTDVADAIDAARFLGTSGRADPARIAISGGSAGGYTVLAALATGDPVFSAGASAYGISDLRRLHASTHKFEAGYLYRLLDARDDADPVFDDRSPLHAADAIRAPVIFFQGLEDKVVPPDQSAAMVAALKANGIRAEYLTFEGEGHGFRRRETIVAQLEAEHAFYVDVLRLGAEG